MKPTHYLAGAALVLAGALGMWLLMPKQAPVAQAQPPVAVQTAQQTTPAVEPDPAAVALPVEPAPAKPEPVVEPRVVRVRRAAPVVAARRAPASRPAEQVTQTGQKAPAVASKPVVVAEAPPVAVGPVRPQAMEPPAIEPAAPPKPPEPRSVTIPAGTLIAVRLNEKVSTATHFQGDTVQATLDAPLVVGGMVLAERGSRQLAKVVLMEPPGRVKGKASIALELAQLRTSDGQSVEVSSETFTHTAASSTKKEATKVGVMAGIGAAIGAIAGGGKGAAIGAGVGGAAGAGTVLGTKGEQAELENETRLTFKLKQPVTLTEKLKE
jgi:hypothetical protein